MVNGESAKVSISNVELQNFRGVVGPFSVDLPTPGKNGSVLYLFGDNGSGKSSICDALEFAARGVVSRRSVGGTKQRREIRNLSGDAAPSVQVKLSDGRVLQRGRKSALWHVGPQAEILPGKATVPEFALSPIVIRRDAVESFWRIPREQRLDFFWDYIRASNTDYRTAADEVVLEEMKAARSTTRACRRRFESLVPKKFWPDRFTFPTHSINASKALTAVAIGVAELRFGERKLSRDENNAIQQLRAALLHEEQLRPRAESANKRQPRDTALLEDLLRETAPGAMEAFFVSTGAEWIRDITFETQDGEVSIWLHRDSGKRLEPEQVLSEASLDLLALLILVEIHIAGAKHGQAQVIVLDDVFQSVDTALRIRTLEHLAGRLTGWQIVVTLHDRLWLELADRAFKLKHFRSELVELRGGGFGRTPTSVGASTGPLRDLDAAIALGLSDVAIAGIAGRALESILDWLSIALAAKVPRRERDRYEISHLVPGLRDEFESCKLIHLRALFGRLEETQTLRNRLGAHHADWGDGLSHAEALGGAAIVQELWAAFLCQSCGNFAKILRVKKTWAPTFPCHPLVAAIES
ncbi:ATP-binding protein [Frigoribacterium sp. 9N]|uniref:ATP-binding protein n=1 Tax=Frigoribacterium sp. 9N TaxID=2653144 RepID=UPI0013568715|nr:ATP-binding protein [Frigoribacterium sp. 9N]